MKCQRNWPGSCNNEDVKKVQLKSASSDENGRGGNVYKGEIINACKGCRKTILNGACKIVK